MANSRGPPASHAQGSGLSPALQHAYDFWGAYFNHCTHYNLPPVLPHISRKQGPGPHCPILAQSCVLVCNMSMAVTSQDSCQMKQCFQKAPSPLGRLGNWYTTAARFHSVSYPSALGCGPDNHPGKAEFPLLQASSIKALARAWWLDQLTQRSLWLCPQPVL